MNFSTHSHVSFVYNIYLVASVVVCACFVCYCMYFMFIFFIINTGLIGNKRAKIIQTYTRSYGNSNSYYTSHVLNNNKKKLLCYRTKAGKLYQKLISSSKDMNILNAKTIC